MYQVGFFEKASPNTIEGRLYHNNMKGTRYSIVAFSLIYVIEMYRLSRYALSYEEVVSTLLDPDKPKVALYSKDSQMKYEIGIACNTTVAWMSNSPVFGSFALQKNSPYTEFFRFQVSHFDITRVFCINIAN